MFWTEGDRPLDGAAARRLRAQIKFRLIDSGNNNPRQAICNYILLGGGCRGPGATIDGGAPDLRSRCAGIYAHPAGYHGCIASAVCIRCLEPGHRKGACTALLCNVCMRLGHSSEECPQLQHATRVGQKAY